MPHIQGLRDPSLFRTLAFVDGAWVGAADGATLDVVNPATGAPPSWRAELLTAWHDAMMATADDLALIMTLEQGKSLAEARGEVACGAGFVRWFAEEARRISGSSVPAPTAASWC